MSFPLLTDEQIDNLCAPGRAKRWRNDGRQYDRDTARIVESATRAPLLAEIERLAAKLATAREDAERWQYVRDNTDISLDSYVWVTTTLGRRVHITSPCRGTEAERAIDAARGKKVQADTQREGHNTELCGERSESTRAPG